MGVARVLNGRGRARTTGVRLGIAAVLVGVALSGAVASTQAAAAVADRCPEVICGMNHNQVLV